MKSRLLVAAWLGAALPTTEIALDDLPASLFDGDVDANAAAFCARHDFGPTPQGLACADAIAADVVLRGNGTLAAAEATARARVLYDQRRFDEAARVLARVASGDGGSHALLGAARLAAGDYGGAVDAYDAAKRAGASSDGLDAALAQAAFRAGYHGRAEDLLTGVLDLPGALTLRSAVRAARGDLDGAVDDAARAAAAAPGDPAPRRHLGMALLDRNRPGDAARAADALAAALAADDDDLGARHALARAARAAAAPPDVVLATFATDETHCGLRRLRESAAGYGLGLTVLAPPPGATWSNGLKLALLHDFAAGLPRAAVLMAVDGYDVAVGGGAAAVVARLARFEARNADVVVFSAEQPFYFRGGDEQCVGRAYPETGAPYRFLNSGSFAGRAGHVAALLARVLATRAADWDGASDQTLLHREYLAQEAPVGAPPPCGGAPATREAPRIVLDAHQELFGNTGGRGDARDFGVRDGALHNALTDTYPVVLHCPGDRRFRAEFARLQRLGWAARFPDCGDGVSGS